jgi:farnesyl-diphosphate farnesyltransferase
METRRKSQNQSRLSPSEQDASAASVALSEEALEVLKQTSRTFFIPISQLPRGLLEAVGSAYLALRAIDEIEDHSILEPLQKVRLLNNISHAIQSSGSRLRQESLILNELEYKSVLPEVTCRLSEWLRLAPPDIAHRIWDATATMADRMAYWVMNGFKVLTEADLNRYTMSVAGAVGLLLCDLWAWYDGTQTNRCKAVGFGRGLQAVNILRNREQDLNRGVDFYPEGWEKRQMINYARNHLSMADDYVDELVDGPIFNFCRMPLLLAHATIDAIEYGREKLERAEVERILGIS